MTEKECYELMLDYCGGEKGLLMMKEMIHVAGVDTAVKNTIIVFRKRHPEAPKEFEDWIEKSFKYLQKEMKKPLN